MAIEQKQKTKVAICYDFDKTLSPRDMQTYGFIEQLGLTEAEFWNTCSRFEGKYEADRILTSMFVMVKSYKTKKLELTKKILTDFGKKIELFDGVETWFKRINDYAFKHDIEVEHYIVSSGIKEMIEGTDIADNFKKIYASYYVYNDKDEPIWPAVSINYTNKTQFLYRINKGIYDVTDARINDSMNDEDKPVPFENMIYIGDSATDIPCMRLVKTSGGTAIGVYNEDVTTKTALKQMLKDDRINYIAKADYSEGELLEKIVKGVLKNIQNTSLLKKFNKYQKQNIDEI